MSADNQVSELHLASHQSTSMRKMMSQRKRKVRFYWIVAAFLPWLVPGKKQKTVVVRLTDGQPDSTKKEKAFTESVNNSRFALVNFNSFRPSCSECQDLETSMKEVAKRFRKTKKKILCASLDGELAVNQKVKEANNVSSLPTLVFYRSGYAISKQEGYQNPATIETWVTGVAGPEVEEFETQAAFDKALKARESQEVVFAAIGGPRLKELLDMVAFKGHKEGWGTKIRYFFWSDGGKGRPFAAVYRGLNEMEHFDASGQVSTETIEEFLKEQYVPTFSQVTAADMSGMFGSGSKGNVFVCFDPANFQAQVKKYTRVFIKAAKKFRGYGFSYFDASDQFSDLISIKCQDFPSVSFKPLRKPFKSYFKSFAHIADTLNEKHIIEFMKESIATHRALGSEL